jgi:hypothetical protein
VSHDFYIAHATSGRTRIRWAGDASEKAGITRIAERIADLRGVSQASPRITTGSIIIEHERVAWSDIESQLISELSLQLGAPPQAAARSGLDALNLMLDRVDGTLKTMHTDLGSVTTLLLIIAAIAQAMRGQVSSSSMSYLWYALSMAAMSRNKSDTQPDPTTDAAGP